MVKLVNSSADLNGKSLDELRALRNEYDKMLENSDLPNRADVVYALDIVEDEIWYRDSEPLYDLVTRKRKPAEELNLDQIKKILERNKRQVESLVERYLEGTDKEIANLLDNLNNTEEALKIIHIHGNGKIQPRELLSDLRKYYNEIIELIEELNKRKRKENGKEIMDLLTTDPELNGPNNS